MTKADQVEYEKWCKDFNVDERTIRLIVNHYVELGERTVSSLTPGIIEANYNKDKREEAEAESKGCIYFITPEFTKYLLEACVGLYKLSRTARCSIIKKYLV